MKRTHALSSLCLAGTLAMLSTTASATLLPCKLYTNDSLFPVRSTVDVWILDTASGTLVTPMTATGLSSGDVELAVERAAEVWNEESGSSIQIRVQGFTHSPLISGALVVTGQPTSCDGSLADTYLDATGTSSTHRFKSGTIEIRKVGNWTTPSCSQIAWGVTANSSTATDLVGVLIHEMGHGVYNLDHPNTGANCTNAVIAASVMYSIVETNRERTLKQWDLELAQSRYTPRTNSATFDRDVFSGTSWWNRSGDYAIRGQTGTMPLVRPGSMPNLQLRFLGWVSGATGAVDGGTGAVNVASYSHATFGSWTTYGGWSSSMGLTRPVAMAGHISGPDTGLLLVYEQYASPQPAMYSAAAAQGYICYKLYSNGIGSYTGGCTSTSTYYFGLTATYDPYSDSYLVGYIADDSMHMGVLEIPSLTNISMPLTNTVLTVSANSAPSIACSGAAGGCKILYEAANNSGTLSWLNASVNVLGQIVVNSSYSAPYVTMDTPSIAYYPNDGSYRLSYTINNHSIYTYKLVGNVLTGTGDAWNDVNSFVSSSLTNVRGLGVYTWFMKYW